MHSRKMNRKIKKNLLSMGFQTTVFLNVWGHFISNPENLLNFRAALNDENKRNQKPRSAEIFEILP